MTERERLHAHIRKRLEGQPEWRIQLALAQADTVHLDGLGHMQTAIDAALATTLETNA